MAGEMWLEMRPGDEVVARGLYRHDVAELKRLFTWADKIVVMEEEHIKMVVGLDDSLSTYVKLINLDVVDMYDYGSDGLGRVLVERFKRVG